MYLYVQKYVHSMEMPKMVVFYKDYFLYSDIPQDQVEILHAYLIGSGSERRDGFVPTWMDYGMKGNAIKALRKRTSKNPTTVTESDNEENKHDELHNGDLEFTKINYEEYFDDITKFTDFCRINTEGFRGEKEDKEGFLLGPSVFRLANKNDPEDMKTYEIFAPRIYIRDSPFDNKKRLHKLVVLRFNSMTFVYLMQDEQLEEYEYTVLYERTKTG